MYIAVIKRDTYEEAVLRNDMESLQSWAQANRHCEFRVFQGSEMEVIKEVQFKPKSGMR